MIRVLLVTVMINISLYAGITGCKYKSDIQKLDRENVSTKFKFDNHCNNIYSPANWNRIDKDGKYIQIQSPHPGESTYKYWVKENELQQEIKKAKQKEKIELEKIKKRSQKKDLKSAFEYGDLIWQDSLINEIKLMKFDEAKAYCANLTYKSYSDWRLPTLSEFKQIRPPFSKNSPYKFNHLNLREWYWTNNISNQFVFSTAATTYGGDNPALVRCVAPRR